jgi:hypothetical protein
MEHKELLNQIAGEITRITGVKVEATYNGTLAWRDKRDEWMEFAIEDLYIKPGRICGLDVSLADPDAFEKVGGIIKECYDKMCDECKFARAKRARKREQ